MAEHEKDAHGGKDGGKDGGKGGGKEGGKDGHGGEHKAHKGGRGHGGGAHAEHEEGVPEWVVSFADNALLQMGFFVIMFAMNVGPKASGDSSEAGKAGPSPGVLDTMISLREAFNNPVSIDSKDSKDLPLVKRMKEVKDQGEAKEDGVKGEQQNVQATRPTGYNNITATVQFEQGSAQLGSFSREVLIDAAKKLRGQKWIVDVRGHCSAVEASATADAEAGAAGNPHDAAFRLSYERALAVAVVLAENGIKWNQLRLSAAGDGDRLTPLAFDSGSHRGNQRVELIVTNDAVAADPHTREPGK